MKSFLLQQLARLILPFAILLGLALLLKGHDEPGGGFVAGLSLAAAGILCVTAYGTRRFHEIFPVEPDRVASFQYTAIDVDRKFEQDVRMANNEMGLDFKLEFRVVGESFEACFVGLDRFVKLPGKPERTQKCVPGFSLIRGDLNRLP